MWNHTALHSIHFHGSLTTETSRGAMRHGTGALLFFQPCECRRHNKENRTAMCSVATHEARRRWSKHQCSGTYLWALKINNKKKTGVFSFRQLKGRRWWLPSVKSAHSQLLCFRVHPCVLTAVALRAHTSTAAKPLICVQFKWLNQIQS